MTETDWTKIPVDTPILVLGDFQRNWLPMYFSGVNNEGKPKAFIGGYPSRVAKALGSGTFTCYEAKLDPSAPSIINWIPNTGVRPECKTVLVRFNDGMIGGRVNPDFYLWDLDCDDEIKEYAIIE